jgi:hypothetical protein
MRDRENPEFQEESTATTGMEHRLADSALAATTRRAEPGIVGFPDAEQHAGRANQTMRMTGHT